MDQVMIAARNAGTGDISAGLSMLLMGVGLACVVAAALIEHYTGKSNFVTRALERWSR